MFFAGWGYQIGPGLFALSLIRLGVAGGLAGGRPEQPGASVGTASRTDTAGVTHDECAGYAPLDPREGAYRWPRRR
jgi:hypothetical protein